MSKSQAKRKPANKAPAPAKPWGWFAAGFFLGAFSFFLALLSGALPDPRNEETGRSAADAQAETRQKQASVAGSKQRYSFYERLPETEVIPPKVDAYDPGTASEDVQYVLQAASFRRHADADELRARLALQGVVTHIQKVGSNDSERWYRVLAGPFVSKREAGLVRKKLQNAKLDPMMLQVSP